MAKKIIIIFLFLLALLPRIYALGETEINPDEITWMVRGKETFFALKQLNFKYFETAWWNEKNDTQAIGLPLVWLNGPSLVLFGKGQSRVSFEIFSDIVAARLPVAVFNSLFIIIFYLFAKKIVNSKIALLSAILLALDPVHIGVSRWVIQDGLLTIFTFVAISSYWVLEKRKSAVILSALALAAGFLTKPNGLLPMLSWATAAVLGKDKLGKRFLKFSLTILVFFIFILILWPTSWSNPIISIFGYLLIQISLVQEQKLTQFFMGQVTSSPHPAYYLFQIFTRLPLLVSLALFIFPVFIFFRFKKFNKLVKFLRTHPVLVAISVFFLSFFILISSSPHKLGVRYTLPLWPWIYLAAGWVLIQIYALLKKKVLKLGFLFVLIFSSLLSVFVYHPNTYLFYNSLVGGPGNAQKYDLIGLCFGIKGATEFVQRCYPEEKSVAILGCGNVTAPYYWPGKITTDWQKENLVIVENSFKQLLPDAPVTKYFDSLKPVYLVKEKKAILARVYQMKSGINNQCSLDFQQ